MTLAFWQAGDSRPPPRAVRDWARVERDRPGPHRYRRAHLRGHGRARPGGRGRRARGRARARATPAPGSASAGCACGASTARARSTRSSARARCARAIEGLLDLALVAHLLGDVGAEVSACEQATVLAPESAGAWSRLAHALARTDRNDRVPRGVRARAVAARRPRGARARRAGARDGPARARGLASRPPGRRHLAPAAASRP